MSGIPEAPTDGQVYGRENSTWAPAVNKAGDTMTGTLIIKGNQFDQSLGTPVPAVLIENASGGDPIGMCVGQFGDCINFIKPNGSGANVRLTGALLELFTSAGYMVLNNTSAQGGNGELAVVDQGGHASRFSVDPVHGDAVIRAAESGAGIALTSDNANQTTRIYMNPLTGDVMLSQTVGPQAGKSVNLTSGKWV